MKLSLKSVTLSDLAITSILCGMSFLSGFVKELIFIFISSFILRFILNFSFLSKKQKGEFDTSRGTRE